MSDKHSNGYEARLSPFGGHPLRSVEGVDDATARALAGLGLDEYVDRITVAGGKTGASLHVNGIDPGWANDVLPLTLSSLSQRIELVRVSEIADYSTYYQPVVMRDIYGFGRPMDEVAMLWQPGILTTAWGPVVRQIAAGLDLVLAGIRTLAA